MSPFLSWILHPDNAFLLNTWLFQVLSLSRPASGLAHLTIDVVSLKLRKNRYLSEDSLILKAAKNIF